MFDEQVTPDNQQEQQAQENQEQEQQSSEQNANQSQEESWLEIGDRKFDKDSARKTIQHGQDHISKLEAENQELREKLGQAKTVEQLEELLEQRNQQPAQDPNPNPQVTPERSTDEASGLSEQDVERILQQREQKATMERNFSEALNKAKEVYGEQVNTKLKEIATSMGMSAEDTAEMARKSPQAFQRLFLSQGGNNTPAPSGNKIPPRGSQDQEDTLGELAKSVINNKIPQAQRTDAIKAYLKG